VVEVVSVREVEGSMGRRVRILAVVGMTVALMGGLTGCQLARAGARCRTTGWGEDGGSWVLQCRNGRWARAMTKAQAARAILAARAPAPTITPPAAPPKIEPVAVGGAIDAAGPAGGDAAPGRIRVQGWVTIDRPYAVPGDLRPTLSMNGDHVASAPRSDLTQRQLNLTLDVPRPDVAQARGLASDLVGFDVEVDATRPTNHICLVAVVSGEWRDLACTDVASAVVSSIGVAKSHIDAVEGAPGEIRLIGWVLATQSAAPVEAEVFVVQVIDGPLGDKTPTGLPQTFTLPADQPSSYVAGAYPALGPNHAIALRITGVPTARYNVCLRPHDRSVTGPFGLNAIISTYVAPCEVVTVP
jgi:hypothetical protein